ncbi:hypothetical protein [Dyella ginsengisoli]|uniref:hypothetical protein n=1 Tax=Dyella ginsengisoli TaxID=363848 RepID=UPI00034BCD77|nr:hypothetical protein [Dyella ginsengisoli]
MTRLRLEQAPAATLPLRFLLAMPCWGIVGGALLLIDGDATLRVRWHPATLALVHVWTLGVLGNAMIGSVLQFLPAAAGAPLRGARHAPWLHGAWNLGALLLVTGLHRGDRVALAAAGTLLPLALLGLGAMTLPGLVAAAGERLLRVGLGAALGYGSATALAGGLLAWRLAGYGRWPLALVDVHAAFGVLGWMIALLAAVARVVMPMFQGTGRVAAPVQAGWLAAATVALPLAAAWHLHRPDGVALPWVVASGGGAFALAALALQWPVPGERRRALYRHWRLGLAALVAAAVALASGAGMLAGTLGLGIGMPLLVASMALEIVPFVAWIDLRRRVPRGTRIPGVQRLLDERHKQALLVVHGTAAVWLLAAVLWPQPWLARLAGAAQLVAWLLHARALAGSLRTARGCLRRPNRTAAPVVGDHRVPVDAAQPETPHA